MRALSLLMVAALAVGLPALPVRADVDAGPVLGLDGGTPLEGLVTFPDGGYDLFWPDGGADVPLQIKTGEPSPLTGVVETMSRARLLAAERKAARDVLLQPTDVGVSAGRVVLVAGAGAGAVVGAAVAVAVVLITKK